MKKHQHSGFTLLELMATISIVAILAAIAIPSFTSTLEKRRIVGAAEQLQSDLRWARAEAIKRNQRIQVDFTTGKDWSYAFNNIDPAKTVSSRDFRDTSLSSNITNATFDPVRGTARTGTATFTLNSLSLSIKISLLGRIRICGNTGGYEKCPQEDS